MESKNTEFEAAVEFGRAMERANNAHPIALQGRVGLAIPEKTAVQWYPELRTTPERLKHRVEVNDVASFVEYVSRFGIPARSSVFATRTPMGVEAIIDHHDGHESAGFCEHRVVLQFKETARWHDWVKHSRLDMDQVTFSSFLEERMSDIVKPEGAVLVEMSRHFEARVDMTFRSVRRASDGSVDFIYAEDVSGTTQESRVHVPSLFDLKLRPFDGAEEIEIHARLRYAIRNKALALRYELEDLEKKLDEVFSSMAGAIKDSTRAHVRSFFYGTPPPALRS